MTGAYQILPALWRRRLTLLTTAVAAFAAAVAVTFLLPKVYTSEAYLLVTPSEAAGSDFAATQLTQLLTRTYAELLQTESVGEAVDRRLGVEDSAAAVSVTPVPQSQLLAIEADAASGAGAQRLAYTYATVFQERLERLAEAGGTVAVAEAASLPLEPSRPRPALYLALGLLLAVLVGAVAALARDRLDQRLPIDASTTELLGLPIIGRLPRGSHRASGDAAMAEASRLLFANLVFANLGERPRTLALVSASEEEGKSTCALLVGQAAAELGIDAVVVEAGLRRPGLLARMGSPARSSAHGLSTSLLRPGTPLRDQVVNVPGSTLDVLPSGPVPLSPAALLGSERLSDFDARARAEYELVIYDTPPFRAGADAALVSAMAEAVILVVDAGLTRRPPVVQAVEQLRRGRANVLGVVVNRAPDAVDASYGEGGLPRAVEPAPPASTAAPPPPLVPAEEAWPRGARR